MLLASDMNNTQFVGATNPDDVLHVTFYMRSIQNNSESEKAGRPIFFEQPFVRIQMPGNQLSIIEAPVREDHKRRFPRQWRMFEDSQFSSSEQVVGTPVGEWSALTRAQAEELRGMKFFTIEQIANCSDAQIQRLGMNGQVMRQKAIAYLKGASDHALAERQAAELAKKDQQINDLMTVVNKLSAQMDQLTQRVDGNDENSGEERQKRKYTRRIESAATAVEGSAERTE